MARGRAWTAEEDAAIRAAAERTREEGTFGVNRLAGVARQLGRSPDAVRKRAQRIGAWSYSMNRSGRRRDGAGDVRE